MRTPLKEPPAICTEITDVELVFGTTRLLPPIDSIPQSFLRGNIYTHLVEAIFFGQPLPHREIVITAGLTPEQLNRVIRAHLVSFAPKHEHNIAGVAYLLSQLTLLSPIPDTPENRHHEHPSF